MRRCAVSVFQAGYALLLSCTVLLAGCGSGSQGMRGTDAAPARPQPAQESRAASPLSGSVQLPVGLSLPPLPVGRQGSELSEQIIMGKAAYLRSAGTELSGNSLLLQPSADAEAWSIYRFNPLQPTDSVKVLLDAPDGAFVAVSNYDAGRWETHGPYGAEALISLSGGGYASDIGELYIAVLASEATTVYSLSLRLDNPDSGGLSAQLQVLPASLQKGELVTLDAGLSFDPNGGIVSYEWDIDGDGYFEASSGAQPQYQFSPSVAGPRSVALRVTDNDGASAIDSALLHVHGFMPGQVLSAPGESVYFMNLKLLHGRPAVAYYDIEAGDLVFRRAQDAAGQNWSPQQRLDTTSQAGLNLSLAIVGGRPAIAYYHATNKELRYIMAEDSEGEVWLPRTVVDSDGSVGSGCCLIGGGSNDALPMIAYSDDSEDRLLFRRGVSTSGSSWAAREVLASNGINGTSISMLNIDAHASIAFSDNDGDLYFVRADDINGHNWPAPQLLLANIDPSANYPSLAIIAGCPAISFSYTNQDLGYIRSQFEHGEEWDAPLAIDTSFSVLGAPSLLELGGRPVIAYATTGGADSAQVRFIQAVNSDGQDWGPAEIASDPAHGTASPASLMLLENGLPALAYRANNDDSYELTYSQYF